MKWAKWPSLLNFDENHPQPHESWSSEHEGTVVVGRVIVVEVESVDDVDVEVEVLVVESVLEVVV